jgi:hypothetical protein
MANGRQVGQTAEGPFSTSHEDSFIRESMEVEQQKRGKTPQPELMTPEEEAEWGPMLDRHKVSILNRLQFDPALLLPYAGQWIAWSPDGSRIVAHADDIDTLYKLVAEAGEAPSQCAIESIDGG